MPSCRKCGQEIEFAKLKYGGFYPVDPEPVEAFGLKENVRLMTEDGIPRTLFHFRQSGLEWQHLTGRTVHFDTCPSRIG